MRPDTSGVLRGQALIVPQFPKDSNFPYLTASGYAQQALLWFPEVNSRGFWLPIESTRYIYTTQLVGWPGIGWKLERLLSVPCLR